LAAISACYFKQQSLLFFVRKSLRILHHHTSDAGKTFIHLLDAAVFAIG
jgi:hypothetical protein